MRTLFRARGGIHGLTDLQWQEFVDVGFVRLEKAASASQLDGLSALSKHIGDDVRKSQNLWKYGIVRDYIRGLLFRDITARAYGSGAQIACYRCVVINKSPQQKVNKQSVIGWHQDVWDSLKFSPWVTVWTAIEAANQKNGCMRVVPGSHSSRRKYGENRVGFLSKRESLIIEHCCQWEYLECEPGDAILLNNFIVHSTQHNVTKHTRKALTTCYAPVRFLT